MASDDSGFFVTLSGLLSYLFDCFWVFGANRKMRKRSLVRYISSLLPYTYKVTSFAQTRNGIKWFDVTDGIDIDKEVELSDEFGVTPDAFIHQNDEDLVSDWNDDSIFDVSSLREPVDTRSIISRISIYDEYDVAPHRKYKNIESVSTSADERIAQLESELNFIRLQLAEITKLATSGKVDNAGHNSGNKNVVDSPDLVSEQQTFDDNIIEKNFLEKTDSGNFADYSKDLINEEFCGKINDFASLDFNVNNTTLEIFESNTGIKQHVFESETIIANMEGKTLEKITLPLKNFPTEDDSSHVINFNQEFGETENQVFVKNLSSGGGAKD